MGNFPRGWAEWNGRYRDTVRRFWRGDDGQIADLAYRLAGSSDVYGRWRRHVFGSINFVTCHDGFTLHDLVSYEHKHNEANGEGNRDGHDDNLSRNWGAEGPTSDAAILELRERSKRNFLATLAFSQGVPMITAGDEIGRTQQGNNNAYCQDSEISWVDWKIDDPGRALLQFARRVFAIRRQNPVLRRRAFFRGAPVPGTNESAKDLTWFRPEGGEMTETDWHDPARHVLGMLIRGQATDEVDERGRLISGDTLLLIVNSGRAPCEFRLPELETAGRWRELVNTHRPQERHYLEPGHLTVPDYTLILLDHEIG